MIINTIEDAIKLAFQYMGTESEMDMKQWLSIWCVLHQQLNSGNPPDSLDNDFEILYNQSVYKESINGVLKTNLGCISAHDGILKSFKYDKNHNVCIKFSGFIYADLSEADVVCTLTVTPTEMPTLKSKHGNEIMVLLCSDNEVGLITMDRNQNYVIDVIPFSDIKLLFDKE